ncbi:MAG: hypothetical protein KIT83_06725 [Bryobacterales bacterium]|nr:hypothetical protein [Bryobacterales bacterium]
MSSSPEPASGTLSPLPLRVLYDGSTRVPPRQITLRAGPLTLLFEPDLAQIRHIRLGSHEVLRAVYGAVRDRNWNTVLPQVSDLVITTRDESFSVRFVAECRNAAVHFVWQGELEGEANGLIRYRFRGKALNTFLRNRIGFCILHPVEYLAGQPVRIETVDGAIQQGRLPAAISPHQPFFNLRAINHMVLPGLSAEVRMEGDTFEMEDQRNWTDASYKTYSTPLGLPFPVEVASGTEVEQTVTISLMGEAPAIESSAASAIAIAVDAARAFPLPPIGACMAPDAPPLTEAEANRLRSAALAHLRADVKLFEVSWDAVLARAAQESAMLRVPLELAVHLSNQAEQELASLAASLERVRPAVVRCLVFHRDEKSTTTRWVELTRAALRPLYANLPIGSGSNAYFTEVNRGRPPLDSSDLVAWSVNPQVHAFDNLSLVETLPMHQETLTSARGFCGDLPLVVSPVSFKPRFNPNATGATSADASNDLPDSVDSRQLSLFGAGWTLGSIKHLAAGGAAAITMYETTGWRGWMESAAGSPLPARFASQPGWAFPLYHVLADWGEYSGGEMLSCTSSAPLLVQAAILRKGSQLRLLMANLSPIAQAVTVPAAAVGTHVRLKRLDEFTAMDAMRHPEAWRVITGARMEPENGSYLVTLLPYSALRLDGVNG